MDNYFLVAIGAVILAALAIFFVLRGRRQATGTIEPPTSEPSKIAPAAPPPAAPAPRAEPHHDRVTDAAAIATADIAGQFLGIDTTPNPPDDLTRLKGLGPKAQSVLNGLGITQYSQLAALTPAQIDKVDAAMGNFAGRLRRDQWIEQARLLSIGDIPGFEARFGKLG
ncbi:MULTISPECIES: hypothetical protein [Sphingomonadales]|uniref:Uncharacterized protein n=2 Tax=Edaphosphingomonas TaxID=3423724 RepID=A0A2T4I2P3_9SPHN|nr:MULTISPECIES: hypothetical protein [Sphingomonas]AGH49531.1 hypothetical protein G432_09030 [Sphingomonas sp. MM-1]MDX3885659.1 hypothetical protein [Sphingomonas sp.]OHT22120.1 50S ribosomal protein L21 [Sphingomonas haloaromaticamans]PTD23398.1 hypothetical protein CV103_08785 [Sphingomonas fennica]